MTRFLKIRPILLLLFFYQLAGADYTVDQFDTAIEPLESDSAIVEVCREFVDNASDMEVIRTAQNRWKRIDSDGAIAHAKITFDANSDSARFVYMYGRLLDDHVEQVSLGKKVIELAPDWVYGYRLVFAPYMLGLFDKRGNPPSKKQLAESFPDDEKFLLRFYELEGDNDISLRFMFSYHNYIEAFEDGLKKLQLAENIDAAWANDLEFAKQHTKLKDYKQTFDCVESHVKQKIEIGDYNIDEKQDKIDQIYTNLLRSNQEWDFIIDYYQSQPDWDTNDRSLYNLARIYALKKEDDLAFDYLFKAAEAGWGYVENTEKSRDLKKLQNDPRWAELVLKMELAWEKGTEKREQKTKASKISRDAFDWALANTSGDTIRLSDLQGDIVIMDFWASWCGPCKAAMPVIDTWYRTEKPENVHVFSVNIWERDIEKALSIMSDNDYSMELLFGNDKLAEHYGIGSIPYICIVDQTGQLRYEEIGYSQELEEKLSWWVQDLSQ